jgi:outer membrane murein-binding lipoprotein Lpp
VRDLVVALVVAGTVLAGCQSTSDATARLSSAVERMASTAVRLDMRAVAQAQGNAAFGGSFDQRIRATGELVPPDRLHLMLDGAGRVQELIIVGKQMWIDAGDGMRLADKVPLGPLTRPTAPLDFIRGPGRVEFVGLGLSRGVVTYRVRMELNATELQARMRSDQPVDPDSTGVVEVEIGLFDGLIHRQTFEVKEPVDPFSGSGLRTLRTTYTIEYWDHGRRLEVREPK